MKTFKIENLEVGSAENILVIPEIGINHNGRLDVAKDMVLSAFQAGAKIIKHQTHIVEDEMSGEAKNIIPDHADTSIYDIMNQCALSEDEELELKHYTESLGMCYLSTPFSRAAADRLEKFGVAAYKIGSGELNNYPLIKHIAEFKKPMIVSTGMNDLKSISKTVDILESAGISYALMHTTNLYPTHPGQVRLGAMTQLMKEFSDIPIGLSDHTTNNLACIAAISLGARIVERHYTDYKSRKGPDIVCSMDSLDLQQLIEAAKIVPLMLGGKKSAIPEEKMTSNFAFASVVAIQNIQAGESFTKENIWVKRPGTGEIPAEQYDHVIGRKALTNIAKDMMIKKDMIS